MVLAVSLVGALPIFGAPKSAPGRSHSGGRLERVGSQKGKIAFIDTQKAMSEREIRTVINALTGEYTYNVAYEKVDPGDDYAAMKKASGADFAIIIIDDEKKVASLVAPDDRWCMVNIAHVGQGLKSEAAKDKFLASRRRRQLMRIYALGAGGGRSSFPGNIADVTSVTELDLTPEQLPVDVAERNFKFLKSIGVTSKVYTTYRKACMEGWAPAPTNDLQKAIWDEVHSIPDKPIKITYDKDREKPVVK